MEPANVHLGLTRLNLSQELLILLRGVVSKSLLVALQGHGRNLGEIDVGPVSLAHLGLDDSKMIAQWDQIVLAIGILSKLQGRGKLGRRFELAIVGTPLGRSPLGRQGDGIANLLIGTLKELLVLAKLEGEVGDHLHLGRGAQEGQPILVTTKEWDIVEVLGQDLRVVLKEPLETVMELLLLTLAATAIAKVKDEFECVERVDNPGFLEKIGQGLTRSVANDLKEELTPRIYNIWIRPN
jgi:hypothetical protein